TARGAAVGATVRCGVGTAVAWTGTGLGIAAVGERGRAVDPKLAVAEGAAVGAVSGVLAGRGVATLVIPGVVRGAVSLRAVATAVPAVAGVPGVVSAVTVTRPRTTASTVRSAVGCGINVAVALLADRQTPHAAPRAARSRHASTPPHVDRARGGSRPAVGLIRRLDSRFAGPGARSRCHPAPDAGTKPRATRGSSLPGAGQGKRTNYKKGRGSSATASKVSIPSL